MAAKRVPVTQALGGPSLGGEASFFKSSPPPAHEPEPEAAPAAAAELAAPVEPKPARPRKPATPRTPRAAASDEDLMACQVYLPEEVLSHAQRLLRPAATGSRRTVTKTMMIAAYARAIHNLGLNIDTSGLDRGMDAEAAQRVEDALRAHFTPDEQ